MRLLCRNDGQEDLEYAQRLLGRSSSNLWRTCVCHAQRASAVGNVEVFIRELLSIDAPVQSHV